MFFIIKEVEEIILDTSQGTKKVFKYNFSRSCKNVVNVFSQGIVKVL